MAFCTSIPLIETSTGGVPFCICKLDLHGVHMSKRVRGGRE